MDPQKQDGLVTDQLQVIKKSKKIAGVGVPDETLRDIISNEIRRYPSLKDVQKSVRHKIHNMVAPYLGDPDYPAAMKELERISSAGSSQDILNFCTSILNSHASSRERLPVMQDFYRSLFSHTGNPPVVLDLACGLNPFALPWMGLAPTTRYYAYDIHRPRVDLINLFFQKWGFEPLAEVRDILVDPPTIKADVAFLFKEAHRLEQRRKGCNRPLWRQLDVRFLLVSLPANSLSGHHDLMERQRHLVASTIGSEPWSVVEMCFGNEMVFCIDKKT